MTQRGYMLIVLMLSMLGISAALLGGAPIFWHLGDAQHKREVLGNAKTALLSYAVNYIDLYGPRGAGLGHLPCPDTDINDTSANKSNQPASVDASWRYDGPNPPCGNGVVANGRLPRHLTALTGRYSFHQQPAQQLLYSVSTRYINNPSNRIVNPITKSEVQAFMNQYVVARVTFPRTADGAGLSVVINRSDIHPVMLRRATEWVVSQLPAKPEHFPRALAHDCQRNADLAILHWISKESERVDHCVSQTRTEPENTVLLAGVPYLSHWFFRNQWYYHIGIEVLPECLGFSTAQCEWHIQYSPSFDRASIQRIPVAGSPNR
jgi:hypothetical protein